MRRRDFILLVGGITQTVPHPASAQSARKIPLVGYLWHAASAEEEGPYYRALIEGWLAAEPQLTAIAIVGRLADLHPDQFGKKQHSIVQRLLRALRKGAAHRLIAAATVEGHENGGQPPGAVDGSGYVRPDPLTAPLSVPALNVDPSANVLRSPAR